MKDQIIVGNTVTIQKTSKFWKLLWLLGRLAFVAGLVLGVIALALEWPALGYWSIALIVGGPLTILLSRLGRWWFND